MKPIVWAWVSDVHAGSTVAVCPERIPLDDGGAYEASKAQRWLWQNWHELWAKVDQRRREHKAHLYLGFNGDLVEGDHHGTTQIMSGNPTAQAAAWNACMKPALDLKADKMVFVRGTEAHVGKSACHEERIALGLQKDGRPIVGDPDVGTATWWHFRADVQGVRIDATHHGRTGMREHTRGGAVILYAHDILAAHVKDNDPHPHLCLRGHYHRWNDSYDSCPVRVIQLPAWQLATGHVKKIAADTMADIGGLILLIDKGQYTVLDKIDFKPSRGAVWTPAA